MPQREAPQPVLQPLLPEQQINRFRQLAELIEAHAPAEQIAQAQEAAAQAIGGDKFQVAKLLPHFMQAAAKNVDAAQVYEHFRLPGRERLVHDRRDEAEGKGKDEKASERARHHDVEGLEIRRGRLTKTEEKTYENYLGDRMARAQPEARAESGSRIERLLSQFEQMLVERFEDGRNVAQESADGKPRFLAKTDSQWKDFFAKFMDRIISKKVSFEEIREFLFRGLVPKGNKGIVISDMVLADGRIEKFVRFGVIADALAQIKALMPGDVFGKEGLGMMGEDLMYLALAVSRGRDIATSPMPAAGKFISGTAEERAAQELGIFAPGAEGRGPQVKGRGRRSPFTGLFDREGGEPEELPYQFIPWWHWGNLKRPSKSRWTTIVFYIALLAMGLLGIGVLTYRLLSGGL